MDTILQELQQLGLGCHIGGTFAAATAYADDLILLSTSLIGMQHMLDLCANLFASADLKFNIEKSVAAECGKPVSTPKCLGLHCVKLAWSKKLCYLGRL